MLTFTGWILAALLISTFTGGWLIGLTVARRARAKEVDDLAQRCYTAELDAKVARSLYPPVGRFIQYGAVRSGLTEDQFKLIGEALEKPAPRSALLRHLDRHGWPPEATFAECYECATKPGSPTLCEPCLYNRALVTHLKRKILELSVPTTGYGQ